MAYVVQDQLDPKEIEAQQDYLVHMDQKVLLDLKVHQDTVYLDQQALREIEDLLELQVMVVLGRRETRDREDIQVTRFKHLFAKCMQKSLSTTE